MNKKNIEKIFCSLVHSGHRFLIISHFSPDGDAVSSSAALYKFLISLKKKAHIFNASGQIKKFNLFLKKQIVTAELPDLSLYDAVFVLDCGDLSRTKVEEKLQKTSVPIINIDHHKTNTFFGSHNIVNPKARATAEILYDIFDICNLLTASIGKILLHGMLTDTLILHTPNITSNFFYKIYKILSLGVSFSQTIEPILFSKSADDIKNLGIAVKRMKYNKKKTIIWSSIPVSLIKKHPAAVWNTGILQQMLSINSAQIIFLLAAKDKHHTQLELRSKKQYDVSKIALHLGGGGHKNAAGALLALSLKKSEKLLLQSLKEFYPQLFTH